mmetsp:Transcript_122546/g.308105  ORF Transcript_122546/g.308105 Transcript_122546/m.308105 type:complete len:93 (+) Transcript_122546:1056-1334(+)
MSLPQPCCYSRARSRAPPSPLRIGSAARWQVGLRGLGKVSLCRGHEVMWPRHEVSALLCPSGVGGGCCVGRESERARPGCFFCACSVLQVYL